MDNQPLFSIVKEDQQSLAYFIEYIKKKYHNSAMIRHVRGNKCATLDTLFDEWSAALQFPLYFGNNLNGFTDCMRGLPVEHNLPHTIVITQAHLLLSDEPQHAPQFWDIVNYITQLPKQDIDTPFKFTFQIETQAQFEQIQALCERWDMPYEYLQGDWAKLYLNLDKELS